MTEQNSDTQRFLDALPFYSNQTLDRVERAWIDQYLKAHPEAAEEIAFDRRLVGAIPEEKSHLSEEVRLARVLREFQQSAPPMGTGQRLLDTLQHNIIRPFIAWFASPMQSPRAFGAVFAMLFVAVTVKAFLPVPSTVPAFTENTRSLRDPAESTRSAQIAPDNDCVDLLTLKLVFSPDSKYEDTISLLRDIGASYQSGPDESGAVIVILPISAPANSVLKQLRSNPLVVSALIAPTQSHAPSCAH